MSLLLQYAQKWSLLIFLLCSMLSTGMSIAPGALLAPLRKASIVLPAILVNFIAGPALAWGIARGLSLEEGHSVGLMLLGCAAGAPFLPKLVGAAKGSLVYAAALMVLLTTGTIIFLPIALPVLVPQLSASPWSIAKPLLLLIVLPLAAGMGLRIRLARFSDSIGPILARMGNVALVVLFGVLVGLNAGALVGVIGSGAILAAILHFVLLFSLGWWLSRSNADAQSALALGAGARNFGAALVPAAGSTADATITVMIIVCAIVGLAVSFSAAIWVKKRQQLDPTKPNGNGNAKESLDRFLRSKD